MNIEEKLLLARQLEKLRVDVIEGGFPISSDGDFESVKRIAEEIRTVSIAGLARAAKHGHRPVLGGCQACCKAENSHVSSPLLTYI